MKELIRLQKFLSQAGVCSRREAETLIDQGEVFVNGSLARLGQSVTPGEDKVVVSGKPISNHFDEKVILMMNKPKGFICSNLDPHNAQTIFQLLPREYANLKLFCVGRLDKDSTGLLLITNDGDLANKIIHPSSNILKRYEVVLNREYDPTLTHKLLKGVKDEEDFLCFSNIIRFPDPKKLEIHLKQGKKREIRRLFEIFGFFVKSLNRFQIGGLILKKMTPGDCRKLTQNEIKSIFSTKGNADENHISGVKKPNRAALRGEKSSAPIPGKVRRHMNRDKEEKLKIAAREKRVKTPTREKPIEEDSSEIIEEKPIWQKGVQAHYKNTRTRGYASRSRRPTTSSDRRGKRR